MASLSRHGGGSLGQGPQIAASCKPRFAMNQPKLVHETVELARPNFVQLEVDRNEHWPIPGLRNLNEIQRPGS
jgi:hypothetical protein